MLELFAAWRGVLHIAEWTGLSLGALATIAAVVYLDPRILKPAIVVAIVALLVYFGVLYGDKVGRADVNAQWADARKAAIAAAAERDQLVELELQRKYSPQLATLEREARDNKDKADTYERKIMALLAKSPAGNSCELGALADRLRRRK